MKKNTKNRKKAMIIGLIGLGITGFFFHFLRFQSLHGSALFYVAVPLILAYVFLNTMPSKTHTGAILKGITIVMLLSGPLLQEGFICIIMAAPLFYLLGGIIGAFFDYYERKHNNKIHSSTLLSLFLLMSLEGTHPAFTVDRHNSVVVKQVIAAPVADVIAQLQKPLDLGNQVPTYLKLFPFPDSTDFKGHEVGDINTLNFVYHKHFYFNTVIGDLKYKIVERGDNFIDSRVISDESYVKTYLSWHSSRVEWKVIDQQHTEVTWRIDFERALDPAWYFGTLQKYTVRLMAEALIQYSATPAYAR